MGNRSADIKTMTANLTTRVETIEGIITGLRTYHSDFPVSSRINIFLVRLR